jgi:transcriptional regulator with GAF, ATPase, and Fis domain
MRARLAVVDGDARPNVIDLAPEQPISIGRSRDNTVVLPHEDQASRLHARVYFEGGRWLLRDFGLNGTRVNNARVNQVTELTDGNEIRIGTVRFQFQLPESDRSSVVAQSPTRADRQPAAETIAQTFVQTRWSVDELSALNQFMGTAIEARDSVELARTAVQVLFYQTGAALAGYFTLDPTDPVPKLIWPDSARPDESLARQLTRRMHRDHRPIWLAEDTAATLPTSSGSFNTKYADALALPLKTAGKVLGAFHLYKASGYFSEKDRKFAEAVAAFAAPLFRGLRVRRALETETARLRAAILDADELLGDSPAMVALRSELTRAATGPRPILLRGEPGTGKDQAAREVHRRGPRSDGPFVAVRCTATPTALLEAELFGYRKGAFSGADKDCAGHVAQADDGTLFLDEVGDLTPDCQAGLLRLIESRSYRPLGATYDSRADVKVIAATRKDLAAETKAGRFRSDLLAALRSVEVTIPPLRAHPEDIAHLAQFFLDRIGAECRREWVLSPDAARFLRDRPWPGNVRQLKRVLGHAAATATGDTITQADLQRLLTSQSNEPVQRTSIASP